MGWIASEGREPLRHRGYQRGYWKGRTDTMARRENREDAAMSHGRQIGLAVPQGAGRASDGIEPKHGGGYLAVSAIIAKPTSLVPGVQCIEPRLSGCYVASISQQLELGRDGQMSHRLDYRAVREIRLLGRDKPLLEVVNEFGFAQFPTYSETVVLLTRGGRQRPCSPGSPVLAPCTLCDSGGKCHWP